MHHARQKKLDDYGLPFMQLHHSLADVHHTGWIDDLRTAAQNRDGDVLLTVLGDIIRSDDRALTAANDQAAIIYVSLRDYSLVTDDILLPNEWQAIDLALADATV